MSDFDNNNRGAIWGNTKKTTDNHPDLTGSIMVDGKDYWLSGWKRKEGANPKSPALSGPPKTVFFHDKKPPVHDKKPQMTKNTEI